MTKHRLCRAIFRQTLLDSSRRWRRATRSGSCSPPRRTGRARSRRSSSAWARSVRGRDARAGRGADPQRAVRPALAAALHARHRPALLVVRPATGVAEEDRAARRRLPPQQPVHVPGDGEARRVLRDDAARARTCPETWLLPHRLPPDNPRYVPMAERYNPEFDLAEIGEWVGYPLYMKPFDGGMWVGVTRVTGAEGLQAAYDESGERMMHLQRSVEDYDVFTRSLSIGPQTRVMRYEPGAHGHYRYQVEQRLPPSRAGARGRAHQPHRQRVLPLGVQLLRDDRQGRPGASDRLRERLARHRARQPPLLLPVGDPLARRLVRVLLGERPLDAPEPADTRVLRGRRPRRPRLRGEARPLRRAGRRLLPDCRVRGVPRRRAPPPRRADGRLRRERRVRRSRRHRHPARGRARAAGGDDRALPHPHAAWAADERAAA